MEHNRKAANIGIRMKLLGEKVTQENVTPAHATVKTKLTGWDGRDDWRGMRSGRRN